MRLWAQNFDNYFWENNVIVLVETNQGSFIETKKHIASSSSSETSQKRKAEAIVVVENQLFLATRYKSSIGW